ncbi:2-succinyl-6-hydroxy-2,4-cyclohexadiene-1-carboxylate synthase [Oceanobacillus chungangensis]|uniref:Putative 2-succinyl-6-hydroxy-2,4-cyclohexadiene-1-carboxylate synthase n=1 Tax=Oceanobacillus chungangensis TaxID=1229152 RepID=A0A3D8PYV4_9BACI|nr:2-succinyl-6-hydroxy-2,4-cyclohexadiene-1-carboxylate synthase [Oceanobacillus chungangensis]RDW20982.1 2-succinyl-6-hydroxy-2,4-cyclohexadiene-1-carboxylate synthase [Oceanobacillus chungangensis]
MYYQTETASYWYEVHGEGIPVVLLHGFTGSNLTWQHFIAQQRDELQIITIDLPGHGKTETKEPVTMEAFCHDLSQLFQYLQLDSIHLVGYSMGGRTALSFALIYPEMIATLVLESASPGLLNVDERKLRVEKDELLAEKIEQEGLASFVNFWQDIPLFQTQKKLPQHVQQAIRNERLAQTVQGMADSLRFMGTGKQPSWWGKLHAFKRPVLLLAGELDQKFVEINKSMRNSLENSELVIVEKAGHAIHIEKSAIFDTLVSEFILKRQ